MEKYSWKAMPCNAMVTGRVSSVLEDADSVTPRTLFTVIKYDHRARPARMETENLLGGYDVEDTEHDFQGRVTKRHVLHHASLLTNDLEEEYSYAYDITGVYTINQLKNNVVNNNWGGAARNGMDLFMTGIGLFGGPVGMGISGLYTVGLIVYDNYNK